MKNTIKKYLSIMLAVAMIVSSLTYYNSSGTDVKAAVSDAIGYNWNGENWTGDANTGHANQFKTHVASGTASVVGIQQPAFATKAGFYITFGDADFGKFSLNGVDLTTNDYDQQGAGMIFHCDIFTQKYSELVVNNNSGVAKATIYVFNNNGTDNSGGQSQSVSSSQTTTSDGYTALNANTWTTVGKYILFSADAGASYQGAGTTYNAMSIKYNTANNNDWARQIGINYDGLVNGTQYNYTLTFDSNVAGTVNTKVAENNGYVTARTVVAGSNELTGTLTYSGGVNVNNTQVQMLLWPQGMPAGAVLNNINLQFSEVEESEPDEYSWTTIANQGDNPIYYYDTANKTEGISVVEVVGTSILINNSQAAISALTINGSPSSATINGAGCNLPVSELTQEINKLVMTNTLGTKYTVYIRNADNAFSMDAPASLSFNSTNRQLSWDAVTNADSYNLYITEPGGSQTSLSTGVTGTTYTVDADDLTAYGTYTFAVEAVNESNSYTTSQTTTTYTKNLSAPTGLSIVGNSTDGYTLTWGAVTDATSYKVFLDSDETGISVNGTSYTFSSSVLAQGTAHTLKVQAINGTVSSSLSEVLNYTVPVESLDAPTNIVATGVPGFDYTITWDAVTNATSYDIYINDGELPSTTVSTNSCVLPAINLPINGRYTIKIIAKNNQIESAASLYNLSTIPNIAISVALDRENNEYVGRFTATWTNPNGTLKTMAYFKDENGILYNLQAFNGWVWNTGNDIFQRADTVIGDTGRTHFKVADGGTFTIVVRTYNSADTINDTTIIGEGEYLLTVDPNTNMAGRFNTVASGTRADITHESIANAVRYEIVDIDSGSVLATGDANSHTNTIDLPVASEAGQYFDVRINAYDSNGDLITTINNVVEDIPYYYTTEESDAHQNAEQAYIDPDEIDDWTLLAGTSSQNGSSAYISNEVYSTRMGGNQHRGYLPTGNAGYNRSTIMQGKNVFTFSPTSNNITTIIVDGIEYTNPTFVGNELVYVGSDCVYIDDSLIDAEPGTTEYHTITVNGSNTLGTFLVKVVGPEIHLPVPTITNITYATHLNANDNYIDISYSDEDASEGTIYNVYVNYPMDDVADGIYVGQIGEGNTTIPVSAFNIAGNRYWEEGRTYNFYLEAYDGSHTSEKSAAYNYTVTDNAVTKTFSPNGVGTKFPETNTNGNNYVYYDLITATALINRDTYPVEYAIDNPQGYYNPTADPAGTRWGTDAADGDPQWITVDLYCEYNIKEIDISWEQAKARDYSVQVSLDGTNFTSVASIIGAANSGGIIEGVDYLCRNDKIVLPNTVEARYVRIYGTTRANVHGYSIWDIGIYGPDLDGIQPDASRYYNQDRIDLTTILSWQEINGRSSVNTATAYVSKALYDDADMFGNHALLGYYAAGTSPRWNNRISDNMDDNNIFGFVVPYARNNDVTKIKSVVVDGEEYFNIQDSRNELVYVGADCVYIDDSLIDAGPGETNYHLVTIVCDDKNVKLETFVVKTVGSDVFSISKNATYEDEYHRNGIEFPDTKVIGGSTMNNYLRYSNVTATTTDDARQGAQYAIDNFAGTRWESKWGDDYSPAESIVIDLGAPYSMKELDISWERANAKNFTIEYSTDGINYTEATTVKNAKASELVDGIVNSDRVDYIVFPTTYEARYIRLTGQYRNLTEVGKYGYSIWEMAVYGPSDSAFLELNNDNGLVLATWPKQAAADSYKLSYTSGGVAKVITIADPNTTSQYFNDDTGYPDNGTEVVLNSYNGGVVIGEPFSVTALADLYVDEVTLNNGGTLLINEKGDVVLTIKNKGTAWINTNVDDFVAEASATKWTPAKSTAGGKANLKPDMTDSTSITFEDFSQSSVGIYTIHYAINTKTDGAEVNPKHLIKERYYGNNAGSTDVEVKSTASYKKNDGVSVEGFQIRTNREPDPEFDGTVAFRTVCKAPNIGSTITVGGEQCTVTGFGTIYVIDDNTTGVHALNRLNSTFTYLNAENIIANEEYKYTGAKTYNGVNRTYGYVATEKAVLSGYEKNGYTYYATTMQGMDALMANSLIVRAFVLTDKGIVYGTASARTSVAEIAYYLHRDSMTDNNGGHDYLYDAILHSDYVVESQYHLDSPFEYGWNKILYETKPN